MLTFVPIVRMSPSAQASLSFFIRVVWFDFLRVFLLRFLFVCLLVWVVIILFCFRQGIKHKLASNSICSPGSLQFCGDPQPPKFGYHRDKILHTAYFVYWLQGVVMHIFNHGTWDAEAGGHL